MSPTADYLPKYLEQACFTLLFTQDVSFFDIYSLTSLQGRVHLSDLFCGNSRNCFTHSASWRSIKLSSNYSKLMCNRLTEEQPEEWQTWYESAFCFWLTACSDNTVKNKSSEVTVVSTVLSCKCGFKSCCNFFQTLTFLSCDSLFEFFSLSSYLRFFISS